METIVFTFFIVILIFKLNSRLAIENLALRRQLALLKQSVLRPKFRKRDRLFWVILSRLWNGWENVLMVVQPETVIRWHRKGFKLLYVFVMLWHGRRKILHFNVTMNPTAKWSAQQIVEACPWNMQPKYLLRDRDGIYGKVFQKRVRNMGIEEVKTAHHSPRQNPYCERVISSIRRDCFNHMIVLNEKHLKVILSDYFMYYHHYRTHPGLLKNTPFERQVQYEPENGILIPLPRVGMIINCGASE